MSPWNAGYLLLPLSAALASWPAAAAEVTLSYRAPDGSDCPAREEFVDALRERGATLQSAAAAARARALDVSIRRVDAAYVGELTVRAADSNGALRTVHDTSCAEVVSGLALTAAIALGGDGRAGEEPPSAVPDTAQSEPPSAEAGEDETERGSVQPSRISSDEALPESEPPDRRWRGSSFDQKDSIVVPAGTLQLDAARAYTLTAGAALGLIPGKVVPRYELDASLASFLGLPDGESRLFGPLLQVHWAVLGPVTIERSSDVTLKNWSLEAGINSCSALTYDTGGWVALICAEFGAGWLFADGTVSGPTPRRFEASPGYGYGGLGFDMQYNFGSWAHLGLRAGARLQTRLSVDSPDGSRLFESSPWGAYGTAGFGLHF